VKVVLTFSCKDWALLSYHSCRCFFQSSIIQVINMGILGFRPASITVAVLAMWIAVGTIRRLLLRHRLTKFRGPWLMEFSHIPHSRAMLGGDCHNWYARINQEYGSSSTRPKPLQVCAVMPAHKRNEDADPWMEGPRSNPYANPSSR
jgi:hypothetical protein